MSGLLDNKSRIIDAILTYEGRRQMAENTFVVKYASFSDSHVVYLRDDEEGHYDPTKRIYLESFNTPYDQIIFEADDAGNLIPFRQHNSMGFNSSMGVSTGSSFWTSFVNGKIKSKLQLLSTSSNVTGSFLEQTVFGSNFASQIQGILTSSFDNFKQLRVIGSADSLFEDQNFALSTNEIEFKIFNNSETLQMMSPTSANTIDTLFNDEKLRNVINFRYLPPIKKSSFNIDKTNLQEIKSNNLLLGDYPAWGPIESLNYPDLKNELKNYENSSKTITFDPTSRDNQIVAQFFEITENEAKKLDVIDYGKISDNSTNSKAFTHHVFFIGKVISDDTGSDCFVHLFTIVFGNGE